MHDKRNHDGLTEEDRDRGVINLMLCGPTWPWSIDDIAREVRNRPDAEDSLARLHVAGLIHRLGDFVFPTRAALTAADLCVGTA
jgi:hypothetical protein